jgi:hypothetical protein
MNLKFSNIGNLKCIFMQCHYNVQLNLDMKPFFIKVVHFNKLPLLFKILTNVVWVPTWVTMNNCWLGYIKIGSKFKLIFNRKIGIKIEIYFLKNQIWNPFLGPFMCKTQTDFFIRKHGLELESSGGKCIMENGQ